MAQPGHDEIDRGYRALHDGALVLDRSDRTRGLFPGAGAQGVLNGLVTNDVAALGVGQGLYAAALTPKGKVIADVRIFRRADDFLVDAPAAAAAGWWGMVRKFVNPRLTRYQDVSARTGDISVFGPHALSMLESLCGEPPGLSAPYAHRQVALGGVPATVALVPDAGVPGITLFVPQASRAATRDAFLAAGAVGGSAEVLEVARIEAGRPAWGADMDENTLAQEVRMDELEAISYTKGCYTGQETVARVHFRGHVNRRLCGVRFASDEGVPPGTALARGDGTTAGEMRSTARSPRLGWVGLAMLRRDVEAGTILRATRQAGDAIVTVVDLPMREADG